MSILVMVGGLFTVAGIAETVQKEIYWAKKRKAYNERRYRMRNRWIG